MYFSTPLLSCLQTSACLETWSTKIRRGICHGVRLQATRCIQIPEQHNNTWLYGESGPGVQLSEGLFQGSLPSHAGKIHWLNGVRGRDRDLPTTIQHVCSRNIRILSWKASITDAGSNLHDTSGTGTSRARARQCFTNSADSLDKRRRCEWIVGQVRVCASLVSVRERFDSSLGNAVLLRGRNPC
jgi:hypothetical protein